MACEMGWKILPSLATVNLRFGLWDIRSTLDEYQYHLSEI